MKDIDRITYYETENGEKAGNILHYLMLGGKDEEVIRKLAESELKFIRNRVDCADFKVSYVLCSIYGFENAIPKSLLDEMTEQLLSFPYDDCGGHGMCTWTENHRLYIDGSELLAAQKFKGRTFGNGKSAEWHYENALKKLNVWFNNVHKFGFSEWCSENYYSETISGLCAVILYAEDDDIRSKAKLAMDMILYDIFSQASYNGGYMYNPAASRAYVDNKLCAREGNYVEKQIKIFLGKHETKLKQKEATALLLVNARDENGKPVYEIPEKIKKLIDKKDEEYCLKQGVDVKDYKKYGLKAYSEENIRYAFMAEAIAEPALISNNVRYLVETDMVNNSMLAPLKKFCIPILYKTKIMGIAKHFVHSMWDGAAIEEGRIYTYRGKKYNISAAFDYRVGKPLFQQNPLALNLSHKVSLFANNPSKPSDKKGSPDYWIGSGIAPRAVAYKNVSALIFDAQHTRYEKGTTHLFFPTEMFDEVDTSELSKGIIYGRTMGVNVCVRTNAGADFVPAQVSLENDRSLYQDEKVKKGLYSKEYDLINKTENYHFYLFEVDEQSDFETFIAKMKSTKAMFDAKRGSLAYENGENKYSLCYRGKFMVNGKEFVPEFLRPLEAIKKLG